MATIIDKDGLSDWNDLCPELINTLKMWPNWDHVITEAEYLVDGEDPYPYVAFCIDAAETVCVCVPKIVTPRHNYGHILFGILTEGTIRTYSDLNQGVGYLSKVSLYTIDSIHVIINNTTLYIGLIDSDITMVPNGIYVGTALSQDETNQLTPIAGWFKFTDYAEYTDHSEYSVCSPTVLNPPVMTYNVKPSSAYNVFLPLVGSSAGVATGIFYRLMSEDEIYNINTISMNGKTFYISGNAVLIDYFEG